MDIWIRQYETANIKGGAKPAPPFVLGYAYEAYDIRILDIGLVHGNIRHADPVLFTRTDTDSKAVLDIKERV